MSYPSFPAPADNYGLDGDHCPECAADWKQPHQQDCSQYHQCEFPPGCAAPAAKGRRLCWPHYQDLKALFG